MKILRENMRRFGTKNLNEQIRIEPPAPQDSTQVDYKALYKQKMSNPNWANPKKVNRDQLLKLIPIGQTPMIMNSEDKHLYIVDKDDNRYELI